MDIVWLRMWTVLNDPVPAVYVIVKSRPFVADPGGIGGRLRSWKAE